MAYIHDEVRSFFEDYVSRFGKEVWTSPLAGRNGNGYLYSAWVIFRSTSGDLDRIEVMNDLKPPGYSPSFSEYAGLPVYLSVLPASKTHYKTVTVLNQMMRTGLPYSGNVYNID